MDEKVPLERLYVAMKWIKCNKDKGNTGVKCKEPHQATEESDMHCDYAQIFDKVCLYYANIKALDHRQYKITKARLISYCKQSL